MPHINVKMFPGRSEEAKKSLADKIMVLAQEELGCPMEALSVSVQDVAQDAWDKDVADVIPEEAMFAGKMYRTK